MESSVKMVSHYFLPLDPHQKKPRLMQLFVEASVWSIRYLAKVTCTFVNLSRLLFSTFF